MVLKTCFFVTYLKSGESFYKFVLITLLSQSFKNTSIDSLIVPLHGNL